MKYSDDWKKPSVNNWSHNYVSWFIILKTFFFQHHGLYPPNQRLNEMFWIILPTMIEIVNATCWVWYFYFVNNCDIFFLFFNFLFQNIKYEMNMSIEYKHWSYYHIFTQVASSMLMCMWILYKDQRKIMKKTAKVHKIFIDI